MTKKPDEHLHLNLRNMNISVNRLWDDKKIKRLGFHTKYTLTDAVKSSVSDLLRVTPR